MQDKPLLPFLGLACALGVSSIYYNQPLLIEMADTFQTAPAHVGLVATATQIGYAVGLLFLVPLGDVLERRLLMVRLFGGVTIALLLVGLAPTLPLLIVASALTGIMASVTHIVLPLASDLAAHRERGRAIGTVMTGLLLGILLARTLSGWMSNIFGWRSVFLFAAGINFVFVPLLWATMPRLPPKEQLNYGRVMLSLWTGAAARELRHWCNGFCRIQLLLDYDRLLVAESLQSWPRTCRHSWSPWCGRRANCAHCREKV
jgi:predicted MFS family arabinose efflux permease